MFVRPTVLVLCYNDNRLHVVEILLPVALSIFREMDNTYSNAVALNGVINAGWV